MHSSPCPLKSIATTRQVHLCWRFFYKVTTTELKGVHHQTDATIRSHSASILTKNTHCKYNMCRDALGNNTVKPLYHGLIGKELDVLIPQLGDYLKHYGTTLGHRIIMEIILIEISSIQL